MTGGVGEAWYTAVTPLASSPSFLSSSQLSVSCAGADDSTLLGHKYASGIMDALSFPDLPSLPSSSSPSSLSPIDRDLLASSPHPVLPFLRPCTQSHHPT